MKVLIIGGTKGIGMEIAYLLGKTDTVLSMARNPVMHRAMKLDLAWPEHDISIAVRHAIDELEGVDWLVCSAGMGAFYAPFQETEESVLKLLQTNFVGTQQVIKICLKDLMKSRGKILCIGSSTVDQPSHGLAAYKASKAALQYWATQRASELAKHHVALNVLSVGWVDTPMTATLKPELREKIIRRIPIGRMAWPQEIAVVADHILRMPHYMTGAVIPMTGGM
jgi:NAD(P)-dependent dehydrogenase (short-subunit alcohol dehydrogenase family)